MLDIIKQTGSLYFNLRAYDRPKTYFHISSFIRKLPDSLINNVFNVRWEVDKSKGPAIKIELSGPKIYRKGDKFE